MHRSNLIFALRLYRLGGLTLSPQAEPTFIGIACLVELMLSQT